MHTSFSRLSSEIYGGKTFDKLTAAEEFDLIEATKHGDTDAFIRLTQGYAPGLRGQLARYNSLHAEDRKQAQEKALVEFWEMIISHEGDKRLSYTLREIQRTLNAERILGTNTLSLSQMYRYLRLEKKYDHNLKRMRANKGEEEINLETLEFIYGVRHQTHLYADDCSLIHDLPNDDDAYMNHSDADELVGIAFEAIADDPMATKVIYLKYGFNNVESNRRVSNDAVGQELSLGRKKVGKIVASSLATMREALGVMDYV